MRKSERREQRRSTVQTPRRKSYDTRELHNRSAGRVSFINSVFGRCCSDHSCASVGALLRLKTSVVLTPPPPTPYPPKKSLFHPSQSDVL
ncbi:hypothetical protein AGIG_G17331 [Arapaima gigas]